VDTHVIHITFTQQLQGSQNNFYGPYPGYASILTAKGCSSELKQFRIANKGS